MKRYIIYSFIPLDQAKRTCEVILLVPPLEFTTDLSDSPEIPWTSLHGIGQYGYKHYMSEGYLKYKVPGVWNYHISKIQKLSDRVVPRRALENFQKKHFKRTTTIPGTSEIVYGYVGIGETLITKATIYALIPKKHWRFLGTPPKDLEKIPKGLRCFHDRGIPEEPVYVIEIPGITECTWLEPYTEGQDILRQFEQTLERI
jgi:hypothetical protein